MSGRRAHNRFVVLQAGACSSTALVWVPLGVLAWAEPLPQLTIIVKISFTWSGEFPTNSDPVLHARVAMDQEPLSRAIPNENVGAAAYELYYPSDFVPRKRDTDILLVGHTRSPTPSPRIEGHLAVAGIWRPFVAAAGAPATAIPLTTAYLQSEDGSPAQPLGPVAAPGNPELSSGEDLDDARYNAAAPVQRARVIPPDATIVLAGLSHDGQRRMVQLPGISPMVTFDAPFRRDSPVDLVCDTLWIDADREIAVLVWRGVIEAPNHGRDIERIVLSLSRSGEELDPEARRSSLMRGLFGFAVREDDPPGAHQPLDEDEEELLTMERYGTWEADAPPPRRSLEQYAAISAELAEWPQDRGETLARHDFDEDSWAVEERGWLETMARAAMDGDAGLAERYGDLFVEAQDALSTPAEQTQTLAEYAEIHAAMDAVPDPDVVLTERKLTLAQWLRMERRWSRAAAADPAVAEELARRVAPAAPLVAPGPVEQDA